MLTTVKYSQTCLWGSLEITPILLLSPNCSFSLIKEQEEIQKQAQEKYRELGT